MVANRKRRKSPEAKRWLSLARDDFKSAKSNISSKVFYVSAFLSQQAAEKALKSVLMCKTNVLIKTHDLVLLGRHVGLPKNLSEDCGVLNTVYIDSRYGDIGGKLPSKKFTGKTAADLLSKAKGIISWAEKNT